MSVSKMKLATRLILGFMAVVAFGVIVAMVGIRGIGTVNDFNDRLYDRELLGLSYIKEANINLIYAGRERARFSAATTPQERETAVRSFEAAITSMEKQLALAQPLFITEQGKGQFANTRQTIDRWLPVARQFFKTAAQDPLSERSAASRELGSQVRDLNQQVDDKLTMLSELKEAQGKKAADAGTEVYEQTRGILLLLTVLSAAFGIAIGTLLTRRITGQLGGEPEAVAAMANEIARGNLAARIDASRARPGSIVAAMSAMQQSLHGLIHNVRNSSECIATAASEIAVGNLDLSQRTEQQASNLQQTAASMEQISGSIAINSETTRAASEVGQAATNAADTGGRVMQQVMHTMDEIGQASQRITDIISVIDGIAFQTNILALNAAVEAARAGEQGRGFAVVAGEVRILAQRSAQAAKEIKQLIENSSSKVDQGSQLVRQAGASMAGIVAEVKRLTDMIHDINTSTSQQSTGVGQINAAVSQLDQVTQQNAALVEESAAAADSLRNQAQGLLQAVASFHLRDELAGAAH